MKSLKNIVNYLTLSIFVLGVGGYWLPSGVGYAKTITEREMERLKKEEAERIAAEKEKKRLAEEKRERELAEKTAAEQRKREGAKQTAAEKREKKEERIAAKKRKRRELEAERTAKPNAFEPEMAPIKSGCFMMGSPETEPERESNEK
ncbi:MAG: hypothetical protein ACRERV_12000, partial [Methylococcales bacterium]